MNVLVCFYCLPFLNDNSGTSLLVKLTLAYFLMNYRLTVMSTRVCAANTESLGTQQFSGFQKDLLNPKSEEILAIGI